MPAGHVLEFSGLTKRFGAITAVSELTCRVEPGKVTALLGPNGAGKTTTLRMLLGLIRPTAGTATIGGRRYADLDDPTRTVGAVLEATGFHPGRSGAAHLTVYAQAAGLPRARVDDVLGLVGLSESAGRKVGGYSLGMRQRLGLAAALLGDPGVLVLDEPTNGLDPEGIRWMRGFLRTLAAEGRTVLVSSHLLGEVSQTVDAALIVSRGTVVFEGSLADLAHQDEPVTLVDSPDRATLAAAFAAQGFTVDTLRSGLRVRGVSAADVGAVAAASGLALSMLSDKGSSLEEVFLEYANGTRPPFRAVPPEPEPEPEQEAEAAVEGEQEAEAPVEVAPEAHADAAVEGEPGVEVEPGAEAEPEADGEPEAQAEADPEETADAEAEADPEPEPEPDPESDSELHTEGEEADVVDDSEAHEEGEQR